MAAKRPNVLLMVCHDLGQHLGCYGVESVHSPRLDALAAGGVRLANSFCTNPTCSPSRSSLATGRWPHSNGCMGLSHAEFRWSIGPDEQPIGRLLADTGYRTALVGFQHITVRGPDEFTRLGFEDAAVVRTDEERADAAAAWLSAPGRGDEPFYLEINFFMPHRDWLQWGIEPDDSRGVQVPPWLPDTPECRAELAEMQGAIRYVDGCIGRVLDALAARGLADDTLVIFCADHGIAMPGAKGTLYDPGLQVATLLRWPAGGIAGGGVAKAMISNIDVLPTVLEAVGLRVPERVQGRSFLPLLRGEAYDPNDAVFCELTYHGYYNPVRGIRTEGFKYLRNFTNTPRVFVPGDLKKGALFRSDPERWEGTFRPGKELYDITRDPWETSSLIGDDIYRDVEPELESRLWRWMHETDDPLLRGAVQPPRHDAALAEYERWRATW